MDPKAYTEKMVRIGELTNEYCNMPGNCRRGGYCCNKGECADVLQAITAAQDKLIANGMLTKEQLTAWTEIADNAERGYKPVFVQEGQCIIPPELRPTCTMHQCDIYTCGVFKKDAGLVRTNEYFQLRQEVDTYIGTLFFQQSPKDPE